MPTMFDLIVTGLDNWQLVKTEEMPRLENDYYEAVNSIEAMEDERQFGL